LYIDIFFYLNVSRLAKKTELRKEVTKMNKSNNNQTSKPVATKASSLLRDGRTSAKTKSVAASALSQTRPSPKKK